MNERWTHGVILMPGSIGPWQVLALETWECRPTESYDVRTSRPDGSQYDSSPVFLYIFPPTFTFFHVEAGLILVVFRFWFSWWEGARVNSSWASGHLDPLWPVSTRCGVSGQRSFFLAAFQGIPLMSFSAHLAEPAMIQMIGVLSGCIKYGGMTQKLLRKYVAPITPV